MIKYQSISGVLLIATTIRVVFHFLGFDDYWGDSYHNLYISWDTVHNDWVYSDYKYRQFVWLPTYRYLASAFMFFFDKYDLLVPHLLNMALGVWSCYLVYQITKMISCSRRSAWLASVSLALLPWHVAFSHYNMSENLCGVFLLLSFWSLLTQRSWLLMISVGLGVLCRNELIFLYFVLWIYLMINHHWKPSVFMGIATGLCLGCWMWWCYEHTGNPMYWVTQRVWGSTNDAAFSQSERGPWYIVFVSLLQAFPPSIVLGFFVLRKRFLIRTSKNVKYASLPLVLVIAHWVFVFILQFKFFSFPDPHYFVITLPLAVIAVFQVTQSSVIYERIILWFSGLSLILLLPTFYFLPYTNYQAERVGDYIIENSLYEGGYIMDFPVTMYHGQIPFELIHSTDELMGFDLTMVNHESATVFLRDKKIRYIMSQDVSFSNAFRIWPKMRDGEPFVFGGFEFTPIYIFNPEMEKEKGNLYERFVKPIYLNKGEAILWRLEDLRLQD